MSKSSWPTRLHRLPDPDAAARRAIATVQMPDAQSRDLGTCSKGMKQRIKMADVQVVVAGRSAASGDSARSGG